MLDALEKNDKIFYEDAGQEFRRPIDEVLALILRDGHFFVAQDGWETKLQCCGRITELCHQGTFDYLGLNPRDFDKGMMCAGGIQGYLANSHAHNVVSCVARGRPPRHVPAALPDLETDRRMCPRQGVHCAARRHLGQSPIRPSSVFHQIASGKRCPSSCCLVKKPFRATELYPMSNGCQILDQPRFALLAGVCVISNVVSVGNNRQPGAMNGVTSDPTRTNNAILYSRRGWGIDYDQRIGQPYAKYVKFKDDAIKDEL